MKNELVLKYNIPGPRYTSYPTLPYWEDECFQIDSWKDSLINAFWVGGRDISLYIHLPFCESLCTYCGCNTRITKNHDVEEKYITSVLREWDLYLSIFPTKPIIKELHLGGGTPTFFSSGNLKTLIEGIISKAIVPDKKDFAFEGHPGNTTKEHLETLFDLGFRRVSFGVQDFDPEVQRTINRIQSFEDINRSTYLARAVGFESVNFDLIYGLPRQSTETIQHTINKTIELRPDRIAFYSYAHIPQMKPAQKSFEQWLPTSEEKSNFYQLGKELLINAGYSDIGMDHFALADDTMTMAHNAGDLHRNFMGYSTQKTNTIVGLGVSAISDSWTSFAQNVKVVEAYYQKLEKNELPILKGHHLTRQDEVVRRKILDLICRYEMTWSEEELLIFGLEINFELLNELKDDGLVAVHDQGIKVLEAGKPFIRNICMAFDVRLWNQKDRHVTFSRTI